jgi:hypothetical protein
MSETSAQGASKKHRDGSMRPQHVSMGPFPLELWNTSPIDMRFRAFMRRSGWGQPDNTIKDLTYHDFNNDTRESRLRSSTTISEIRKANTKCQEVFGLLSQVVAAHSDRGSHYIPLRLKNISNMQLIFGRGSGTVIHASELKNGMYDSIKPVFTDEWKYDFETKTLTLSMLRQRKDPSSYEVIRSVNPLIRIFPGEVFDIDLSIATSGFHAMQPTDGSHTSFAYNNPWERVNVRKITNHPIFINFHVNARSVRTIGSPDNSNSTTTTTVNPDDQDNTVSFFLVLDSMEVTYAQHSKHRIGVHDKQIRFFIGTQIDDDDDGPYYHYDSDLEGNDDEITLETLEV